MVVQQQERTWPVVPAPPPHPNEDPADTCRRLGWQVGDRLVSDEGYGPTTITITAIGDRQILAKSESGRESSWVLWCRPWVNLDIANRRTQPPTTPDNREQT